MVLIFISKIKRSYQTTYFPAQIYFMTIKTKPICPSILTAHSTFLMAAIARSTGSPQTHKLWSGSVTANAALLNTGLTSLHLKHLTFLKTPALRAFPALPPISFRNTCSHSLESIGCFFEEAEHFLTLIGFRPCRWVTYKQGVPGFPGYTLPVALIGPGPNPIFRPNCEWLSPFAGRGGGRCRVLDSRADVA